MPKLHLDWSDGRYSTRTISDEEVGIDVVHLEDGVYAAYLRDCERDAVWQAFWRAISNEQYMRRRETELMPLEDAEREIRKIRGLICCGGHTTHLRVRGAIRASRCQRSGRSEEGDPRSNIVGIEIAVTVDGELAIK